MDKILYKLDTFEGPLDLLLTLIQKNKVSIYDIPIVEITAQYLEAIEGIEGSNLDNTSEFLVMASHLLYIKSKMLLPKPETDDDEEDPREELQKRLIEYQQFKEASKELRKSEFSTKYMVFRESEKIDFPIPEYDISHTADELIEAFNSIMSRRLRNAKPEKRAFSQIVGREKVSVDDMVEKICKVLKRSKKVRFENLFSSEQSRPEMIATFLAVLEMIRLSRLYANYDEDKKDFILTTRKNSND
ncbi:MAG: segregation/condensation protein A [Oscillospiraceae bacterium]|nr:segregation/condensation protein A [Oscillospiraceae bacterium]